MSYTDDAVLAKLSALNETQESIVSTCQSVYLLWTAAHVCQVTVAQWVMFHRYANAILPDSTNIGADPVQETRRSNGTALAAAFEGLWKQQEAELDLSR